MRQTRKADTDRIKIGYREIKRFYRQKMKAVHSLQRFTNYFEHAHLNHFSNVKNMVIYLIIRTLKNIFLTVEIFKSKI